LAKTPSDEERAQAAFKKKELQAREGKVAMAEYLAAGKAEREKTAKLRAMRLAKEESDRKAAMLKAAAPTAPQMAGASKTAKSAMKAAAKPAKGTKGTAKPAAKAKKRQ
jgi:hypothetical protein